MYDILKGPDQLNRSLPALPHGRKVKETLRFNTEKVVDYRRELSRRLDSNHGLIRLIGSLNVSLMLRDEVYVDRVADVALQIANSMRLTSVWGPGKVHEPGWCYGPGNQEIILTTVEQFDVEEARMAWKELQPLRVMSHAYADFTLPHLDGSGEGLTGAGPVILVLNVPMLAFQYKCWWEKFVRDNSDSPPSMNLFFPAYPLANLLFSHMDITLTNRLMSLALDKSIVEQTDPNPFYLNFYNSYTDLMLGEALVWMERRGLTFDDWISAMPCIFVNDFHMWLRLPDLAFVTQMEWAIFMARLPILAFLVKFNAAQKSEFNQPYLNHIKHWVRRMLQGRLFGHGLRGEQVTVVVDAIDQTIVPYL